MQKKFVHPTRIYFRQTDMAGIALFTQAYQMAHDAYEHFVEDIGLAWKEWFQNPQWVAPIRHSEAEYFAPLKASEHFQIQVSITKLSESSLTTQFEFINPATQKLHCTVRLSAVFVGLPEMKKTAIPAQIVEKLKPYLQTGV